MPKNISDNDNATTAPYRLFSVHGDFTDESETVADDRSASFTLLQKATSANGWKGTCRQSRKMVGRNEIPGFLRGFGIMKEPEVFIADEP